MHEEEILSFAAKPVTNVEGTLPMLQCTAATMWDPSQVVPHSITIVVMLNGKCAGALVDTGFSV